MPDGLEFYGMDGELLTLDQWVELYRGDQKGKRQVAETKFRINGEEIRVSTILLGLDHGFYPSGVQGVPIIFETMIFGGKWDGTQEEYQTRCATKYGAIIQHQEAVKAAIEYIFIKGREVEKESGRHGF